MFKKLLGIFKRKLEEKKKSKKNTTKNTANSVKDGGGYDNRFQKFYHLNKKRLNLGRRSSYSGKKKSGICVRCKRRVVPGIVFCEYHRKKQKEYNRKARSK